jgi:hypothetical protein
MLPLGNIDKDFGGCFSLTVSGERSFLPGPFSIEGRERTKSHSWAREPQGPQRQHLQAYAVRRFNVQTFILKCGL